MSRAAATFTVPTRNAVLRPLSRISRRATNAAGGSLASRVEDAQNIGFPLQLPLLIAYFTSFSALFSGTANPVVKVLAYLPPTAPIAMPVLSAVGGVGPVGIAISVILTLASAVLLIRLAGRVYSRAILRTGRRIKVREVLFD